MNKIPINKAYCLTLKPNPPIVEQLKDYISVEDFLIGRDIIDEPIKAERPQIWNYWRSIQSIIKIAKNHQFNNILFLEEDAITLSSFNINFNYFCINYNKIKEDTQWDLFFLGSNCMNGVNTPTKYDNIIKSTYILDHHAVIYNNTIFDLILGLKPSTIATYDGVIADYLFKGIITGLSFWPSIITQKPGWSKNEQRYVDRSINHNISF